MASPRRATRPEAGQRSPAARDPGTPPPLSGPRRLGVGVVVGALLVSIVLAMGGPVRPGADPDPTPPPSDAPGATATPQAATPEPQGPVPAVVPVILPPSATLLTTRRITLTVTIPAPGEGLKGLTLRVYRNGELAMQAVRVRDLTMAIKDIPLKRNQNRLAVALANAAGEGPRSEVVIVTVDDRPPKLEIKEPDAGSVINSTLATVRGITEPGLTVIVRNPGFGDTENAVADDRGVFITELRLDKGSNHLELTAQDAAGNTTRETIDVVRGDAQSQAKLSLSKPELRFADLPQTINIKVEVDDPDGRPVADGVSVVFTLSPPGLDSLTYVTTTRDGVARWDGVLIQGASRGNGYVTARAALGGGLAEAVATKPLVVK